MDRKNIITFITLLVMVLIIIGLWHWFSSQKPTVTPPKEIDRIVIGSDMDITGIYPKIDPTVVNYTVSSHFYEGLISFNKDGRLTPQLLENWVNPDDLTWEMHLKQGVKFHNGQELTAEDVKFSLEEAKKERKEEAFFPNRSNLDSIDKIEVVDPYTVKVTTKNPFPVLMNMLSGQFILSKDYIEKNGYDADPVGTGPYKFVKWEKGKEVVLARNEDYYGQKPVAKEVVFRAYPDKKDRIESLTKGETDLIFALDIADIEDLEKAEGVEVVTSPVTGVNYIGIDIGRKKSPYVQLKENPFQSLKVRQALVYGLNKEAIIQEVFEGRAIESTQIVTPDIYGYNPNIKPLPYDAEKAKKLLEETGYKDGFKVTLDVPNDERADIAKVIAKQLAKIGIKIEVNAMPRDKAFEKIIPADYGEQGDTSLYIIGLLTDTFDASDIINGTLHTSAEPFGDLNIGGYSNSEVDELIEKAQKTVDQQTRLVYLQDAIKIATEDVAYIPLYTLEDVYAISEKIQWTPRSDASVFAWEIYSREQK